MYFAISGSQVTKISHAVVLKILKHPPRSVNINASLSCIKTRNKRKSPEKGKVQMKLEQLIRDLKDENALLQSEVERQQHEHMRWK